MDDKDRVKLVGITKSFGALRANDGIDLVLLRGEIHAVLGENGAGKTTLMNILSGLYRPDAGTITLWGEKVVIRSPRDALALGIGMVHQHFELVDVFTVTQNMLLGHRPSGLVLNLRKMAKVIAEIGATYGFRVDPDAYIWQLSVGEKQRVEILRLLHRGAELMILDEPTSVLTPGEADELYRSLRRMADANKTVVFITHKLHEVMAVADRVTVLRAGQVVGTVEKAETTMAELTRMMIGRDLARPKVERRTTAGAPIVEVKSVLALGDRGTPALREVCLELYPGEILGVAGVAGNGQRELAEVITGLRQATRGCFLIAGRDLTGAGVLAVMNAGLRYVPEERLGTGLVPDCTVTDNVILRDFWNPPFCRGQWINRRVAEEHAQSLIRQFDIKTQGTAVKTKDLSGGNLQKLLVARELAFGPRVLVVAQPTRGLDVGATEAVRKRLVDLREQGTAILLISEDLDEVLALSDRVAVMFGGRVVGVVPSAEANRERLGTLMSGQVGEATA